MMAALLVAVEMKFELSATSDVFGGGFSKQTKNASGCSNSVINFINFEKDLEMKFKAVSSLIQCFSPSCFLCSAAQAVV